jgi:hypothetical protein
MKALLLALSLAVATGPSPSPAARPAPPRPGLTWEAADALDRRLKAIEAAYRARRPIATPNVVIRQAELNSWVNLTLAPRLPPGVSDLDVLLEKDRVTAKGMVDLDKLPVKEAAGGSSWNPINLLGGRVAVELRGRLTTPEVGFGSFEAEEVLLATFRIPPSVVAQAVARSTRSAEHPEGFDILAPFRLPYAAKRVRLQPGKALLEF